MSDSHKKAIIKDRIRNKNPASAYWKPIRRVNKQIMHKFLEDIDDEDAYPKTKNPKEVINDYDYSDYKVDYEYTLKGDRFKESKIKNKRK